MEAILNPYYGLLVLFLCLIYPYERASKKNKDRMVWLLLVLFTLFFGLRGPVGDDYDNYRAMYNHESFTHIFSMPAFALAMELFKALHIPFEGFIFATSCLINGLLFRFMYRQQGNLPFLLSIFWGMSGVVNEIDFVRNTISILLFANSWSYIQEDKPLKFFLMNILGALCHYSALLYLPFYYLVKKALPSKIYLGIIITSILLFFLKIPFLNFIPRLFPSDSELADHMYKYISTYTRAIPFTIAFIERLLTAIAIFICYEKLISDKITRTAVYTFLSLILSYALFSNYGILGTRIANLFIPCYWILWPALIRQVNNKGFRLVAAAGIYIYLFIRILTIVLMAKWHYTTIFT